jgi:16S rRNA (uracil1498-N3)-methyltransferase
LSKQTKTKSGLIKKGWKFMHRFFVCAESVSGEHVNLTGSQAHQINNVLRLKAGEHVILLDNTGYEYTAVLTAPCAGRGRPEVTCKVISKQLSHSEPQTQITLYQSLLVRQKFEWVLQKCTEVGVSCFVPVITQRSIIRSPDIITTSKRTRWQSIVTEAAEQSARGRIPEIREPLKFADALDKIKDYNYRLIGAPDVLGRSLRGILRNDDDKPSSVALFIGPEGGFTDEELAAAKEKMVTAFSLGRRILRTETAAIVTTAIILYELE